MNNVIRKLSLLTLPALLLAGAPRTLNAHLSTAGKVSLGVAGISAATSAISAFTLHGWKNKLKKGTLTPRQRRDLLEDIKSARRVRNIAFLTLLASGGYTWYNHYTNHVSPYESAKEEGKNSLTSDGTQSAQITTLTFLHEKFIASASADITTENTKTICDRLPLVVKRSLGANKAGIFTTYPSRETLIETLQYDATLPAYINSLKLVAVSPEELTSDASAKEYYSIVDRFAQRTPARRQGDIRKTTNSDGEIIQKEEEVSEEQIVESLTVIQQRLYEYGTNVPKSELIDVARHLYSFVTKEIASKKVKKEDGTIVDMVSPDQIKKEACEKFWVSEKMRRGGGQLPKLSFDLFCKRYGLKYDSDYVNSPVDPQVFYMRLKSLHSSFSPKYVSALKRYIEQNS